MSSTAYAPALRVVLPTMFSVVGFVILLLLQAYSPSAAAVPKASASAAADCWSTVAATHLRMKLPTTNNSNSSSTQKLFCQGATCRAMSNLLPSLKFKRPKQTVTCTCSEFTAGSCFAPGCFVCAKSCFTGGLAFLAAAPGPFGTGLLCSSGCLPCCQRVGDASKPVNSTCDLVGTGC